MSLMTEPIGLKVRGDPIPDSFDDYGNQIYGPGATTTVYGWYEPRSSGEDAAAREQQVWGYWVYLPLSADLSGADAVVIDGAEYQVVGEPGRQPGGFLVEGFIKAAVERVTG